MGRTNTIPESATLIHEAIRTIPTGPSAGRELHARLYAGYASQGASSHFTRIPHRWYRLDWFDVPGNRAERRIWSYSGRNLDQAARDFYQCLADVEAASAAPAASVTVPA